MKRKVLAILIAAFMVVGYMPTIMGTVLAEEGESNARTVSVDAVYGSFDFVTTIDGTESVETRGQIGWPIENETTVQNLMGENSTIRNLTYWDNERVFDGWYLYEQDDNGMTKISNDLLTTDQMLTYQLPAGTNDLVFQAQWQGAQEDYMCDFFINAHGGSLSYVNTNGDTVSDGYEEMGLPLKVTEKSQQRLGEQLKEHGIKGFNNPVGNETLGYFEGWYKIVWVDGCRDIEFNDGQPAKYTTEQLAGQNVPEGYFGFVAKWSEVEFGVYEDRYTDNAGGGEGEGGEPMGPGLELSVVINEDTENPIVETKPAYEFFKFLAEPGDDLELTVNGTEEMFTDPDFSWSKMGFDVGSGNTNLNVTSNTCIIEDITEDDIDNFMYVCLIRDGEQEFEYWFAPCSVIGGGDGGGEEIPFNEITIEYRYYNRDGVQDFFPVGIVLFEPGEDAPIWDEYSEDTTYGELINANGQAFEGLHYKGLPDPTWTVVGSSVEPPPGETWEEATIGNCQGGFTLYVNADYGDVAPVPVNMSYYDENNNYTKKELVVVLSSASNKTYQDVMDWLEFADQLSVNHYNNEDFLDWSWDEYRYGAELENSILDSKGSTMEFVLKAKYKNQPINVTCMYKDAAGETVTVTGPTVINEGEDIYSAFEQFLEDESVDTTGVTGWAISSDEAEISSTNNELIIAAVYDDYKPVYYARYFLKYDSSDGNYYTANEWNKVLYVNEAYPESEDECVDFADNIIPVFDAKFGGNPGEDITFYGYRSTDLGVNFKNEIIREKPEANNTNEPAGYEYRFAPVINLEAMYDKVLVEIIGADGGLVQMLHPAGYSYELGTGGIGERWNVEGTMYGGNAIPGGTEVCPPSPYVRYTMWSLKLFDLEEAPEGVEEYVTVEEVKEAMDEKTLAADASLDPDAFQVDYYDATLLKITANGVTQVTTEFPEEGIWVEFPYPEGTDQETTFVVAHMFAHGENAGDIEIIEEGDRLVKTERGVKVLMYSLSPISLAYGDTVDSDNGDQGGTDDPSGDNSGTTGGSDAEGTDSADKTAKTGDDFNMAVPMALAVFAALMMAAAVVYRKRHN